MSIALRLPNVNESPDQLDNLDNGIPDDFVMARDAQDNVISRFGNPSWDLRIYGAKQIWHFNTLQESKDCDLAWQIEREIKSILFLFIYHPAAEDRGNFKKLSTLSKYFNTLRRVGKIALHLNVTLEDAHQSDKFQAAFRASIASKTQNFRECLVISQIIGTLYSVGYSELSGHFCKWRLIPEKDYDDVKRWLTKLGNKSKENRKQTAVIPTRILSFVLYDLIEQIRQFNKHSGKIFKLVDAAHKDPRLFYDNAQDWKLATNRLAKRGLYPNYKDYPPSKRISRKETVRKFGLESYFKKNNITTPGDIQNFCGHIQAVSITLVHAFTGMRKSEREVMPFHSAEMIKIPSFGSVHAVLSHTTKMSGANYSEGLIWVASPEAHEAIKAAQSICRIYWCFHQGEPFPDERCPLFLSREFYKNQVVGSHYGLAYADQVNIRELTQKPITITEQDLAELETFDAFRDWRAEEKFQIGNPWPFHSHQFRRSLAVYASRSGMVSLPSLGTQFKHITTAMTVLYAENSAFAKAFVTDESGEVLKSHTVVSEFRESQRVTASVQFFEKAIADDSKLFGGQGHGFQRLKENDEVQFFDDAEKLKKQIADGTRSGVLLDHGGMCMRRGGPCEMYGLDWAIPCLDCGDAFNGGDSVEPMRAYVESVKSDMEAMSPDSMPYKSLNSEVQKIEAKIIEVENV